MEFFSVSVVVMLSRNKTSSQIIIVGQCDFAIRKMWATIQKQTRWTEYIENLLNNLTVNGSSDTSTHTGIVDMAQAYPYRVKDIALPLDSSGYVYLIASTTNFDRTYVGETDCLSRRIREHNSGYGSTSTAPGTTICYKIYTSHHGHNLRHRFNFRTSSIPALLPSCLYLQPWSHEQTTKNEP